MPTVYMSDIIAAYEESRRNDRQLDSRKSKVDYGITTIIYYK